MALNKGTWDPKPKRTNIKGTNLQSLNPTLSRMAGSLGACFETFDLNIDAEA